MADNLLDKASILLTPTAYNDGSMLSVKPENGDGDFTFSRSSAATRVNAQGLVENVQIISSELVSNGNFSQIGTEEVSNGNFSQEGSELVTNGDFATDSDWSKGTGWSIEDGVAKVDNTNTNYISQDGIVSDTKTYAITFTILNYISGSIRLRLGNTYGDYVSGNGTYTKYIQCTTSNKFRVYSSPSGANLSIDNVSVKEVGQDWSLETGWSIGEDIANCINGSGVSIYQTNAVDVGKQYKLTFNVSNYSQGWLETVGGFVSGVLAEADGYYEVYGTAASTTFGFSAFGSFNGSITNISVKEVGQDWTFGTGWSIGDGVAESTALSTRSVFQNLGNAVVGKKYKITYTILETNGGNFKLVYGGVNGTIRNSVGTYTEIITATSSSDSNVYFDALNVMIGKISNISVKEITDDTDLPRINYEGFSYQDSLGSEEVVNGDFSNGFNLWTNEGGVWSIQNNYVNGNGANGANEELTQSNVTTVGKTYKVIFEVLNYVSGSVTFLGTDIGNIVANGVYTTYYTASSSVIRLRGTNFNGSIDNVSVKEYLGQEVVPDSGCGSWLLEGQSTNIIPYSEDFSNAAWVKGNVIITPNQGISPDGLNNAFKYVGSSIGQNFQTTINVSSNYTYSFYVKAINSPFIRLRTSDGSCWFNMTTNAVATNTFASAEIKSIGNNWYRLSVTSSSFTSSNSFFIHPHATDNTTSEMNGAEFLLWGAQVENQSFSTSYIPTSGAANTRLQDIANNSGNSTLINSTEGVLYAEIAALSSPVDSPKNITISDGTVNNYVRIEYYQDGRVYGNVYDGTSVAANFVVNQLNFNKVAIQYSSSGSKLYVNGTGVDFASKIFTSNTLNTIQFSSAAADSNYFYGKNKALAVYKEALTDANLRSLTYPNPVATTFDLDFDTIAEQFTFTRGSEATFVNAQGLIESTASNDAPRIDYSTGAKAFLLEPQSTNLIPYSEDFSEWTNTRSSDSIGFTSPNGTNNATLLITESDSASNNKYIQSDLFNISSGAKITGSVFLKANQLNWARVILVNSSLNKSIDCFFNLESGVVGTSSATGSSTVSSTSIEDYGNGWFRCNIVGDLDTSTNCRMRCYLADGDNDSSVYGDGTSGIYIYGAQIEQQSYATSYIPTSGASATRNQELCNNATPVINSEEGTLYAEMATLADTDSIYRAISVSDGTTSNRAIIRYNLGASDITFLYVKDGVASANIYHIGSEKASDFNKFAFSWKLNEFKVYLNGTQVGVTDTVGNVSNAFTKLSFNDGVANPFYGNTKGLKVYPKALADVQLEDLTS